MEISIPNEHGVLAVGCVEIVAQTGRSHAAVEIAKGADGRYRYNISLWYGYGGFGGPICADGDGFGDLQAAKVAGMEKLLHRWPVPFPTEPQSVHDELRLMRDQIEGQLRQRSHF